MTLGDTRQHDVSASTRKRSQVQSSHRPSPRCGSAPFPPELLFVPRHLPTRLRRLRGLVPLNVGCPTPPAAVIWGSAPHRRRSPAGPTLVGVPVAKRRKDAPRRKLDDLPWLLGVGLVGYIFVQPRYGSAAVALLGFVIFMVWVLFLMPTRCHWDLGTHGCTRTARGKINGCKSHNQRKHDAVCAALGLRNPGTLFRVTWAGGDHHGWKVGRAACPSKALPDDSGTSPGNKRQGRYGVIMLVVTAIGSVAGVLALFVK